MKPEGESGPVSRRGFLVTTGAAAVIGSATANAEAQSPSSERQILTESEVATLDAITEQLIPTDEARSREKLNNEVESSKDSTKQPHIRRQSCERPTAYIPIDDENTIKVPRPVSIQELMSRLTW